MSNSNAGNSSWSGSWEHPWAKPEPVAAEPGKFSFTAAYRVAAANVKDWQDSLVTWGANYYCDVSDITVTPDGNESIISFKGVGYINLGTFLAQLDTRAIAEVATS